MVDWLAIVASLLKLLQHDFQISRLGTWEQGFAILIKNLSEGQDEGGFEAGALRLDL